MSNIRRGGTHPIQSNELCDAVQLLADHGFEGMANAMQILLNEAMKIERNEYLGAEPYQRTQERRSYANGFKDKTLNSRLGKRPSPACRGNGVSFIWRKTR